MEKQKPVHEIRLGAIRATIWANRTNGKETWFSTNVSRLFKDGAQWKDSGSFRRDDLPIVSKVLDMAYAWIWDQQTMVEEVDAP